MQSILSDIKPPTTAIGTGFVVRLLVGIVPIRLMQRTIMGSTMFSCGAYSVLMILPINRASLPLAPFWIMVVFKWTAAVVGGIPAA